jgi:hypothetical protein
LVKQFIILAFILIDIGAYAQNGNLVLNGNVTLEGAPLPNAEIKIFKPDGGLKYSSANNVGKFVATLDLGTEYIISVSEKGYSTRTITVLTELPHTVKGGEFSQTVTIDLRKTRKDYEGKTVREETAGGVMFNEQTKSFVTVTRDISRIKEDIAAAEEAARKRKEVKEKAMAQLREQQRLDSIIRAREQFVADSIANWAIVQEQLKSEREQAVQDSLAAVAAHLAKIKTQRAKQRENELNNEANKLEELAAAERGRKRLAALEEAKADSERKAEISAKEALAAAAKSKKDSIANAKLQIELEEQALQDSLTTARETEKLAIQQQKEANRLRRIAEKDSIAGVKEAAKLERDRLDALETERRQAVADSIAAVKEQFRLDQEAARLAEEVRKQAVLDSIANAKKMAELAEQARMDSIAAAREQGRIDRLLAQQEADRLEKAHLDSIAAAKEDAKQAEIARVRKQQKENSLVITVDKDASNTTTITVSMIYGVKTTYKKIAHSWGDVFYYKGEAIISEALYKTEMQNARNEVNPENISEPEGN